MSNAQETNYNRSFDNERMGAHANCAPYADQELRQDAYQDSLDIHHRRFGMHEVSGAECAGIDDDRCRDARTELDHGHIRSQNPISMMQSITVDGVASSGADDEYSQFDLEEEASYDVSDAPYMPDAAPVMDAQRIAAAMPAYGGAHAFETATSASVMGMPAVVDASSQAASSISSDAASGVSSGDFDTPRNNVFLTVIAYVLVALYAAWQVFSSAYDNDIWFILATGKEILDQGIFYTNPFSLHENMGIVVQQWLVCVISYLIYSAGGFVGLGLWVLVLFALMTFSFYKVARILRGDRGGSEVIALIFIPLMVILSSYTSVRPHLYTMIAFIWVVGLLSLYRRSSKIVFLVPLPFLVALHVNFQASMAPFDLVIMACYVIPNFLKPLHRRGKLLFINGIEWDYKRLPLLIVMVVSAAALLINPYFIDGALYLVSSYGSASYRNYISEMNPLAPATNYVYALAAVFFIISAAVIGSQGLKRLNVPLLCLAAGTTVLSFMQIRNIWLGPLFCSFYLVSIGAHHHILFKLKAMLSKVLSGAALFVGAIGCCLLIAFEAPGLQALPNNTADTPVAALDYLDEIGADKDKTRILNFFNSGGYFEYRGYKVVMDPRPELWAPSITGLSFDYYREFVDMTVGDTYIDDYIEKYDLNVYVVDKTDPSVEIFKDQEVYFEISGGPDYRAFILKEAYPLITGKDISTAPDPVRHTSKKQ